VRIAGARGAAVLLFAVICSATFSAVSARSAHADVGTSKVGYVYDFGTGINDTAGPGSGSSIFVNALTGQSLSTGSTGTYGPYEFTNVPVSDINTHPDTAFNGFDSLELYMVCDLGAAANSTALSAVNRFIEQGGKVMITDGDRCNDSGGTTPDYRNFEFPFTSNNPGPRGASGAYTQIEDSTLTHGLSLGPQNGDSVGDANIFQTHHSSWFAAIKATNVSGVNGAVESYARTRSGGLAIFEGEDFWFTFGPDPHLKQVFDLMLGQRWNPDGLPRSLPASTPCPDSQGNKPLLFVPGVTGTFLQDTTGDEVWPNAGRLLYDNSDFLDALGLKANGIDPVDDPNGRWREPITVKRNKGYNGAIDQVLPTQSIYKDTVDYLTGHYGYQLASNDVSKQKSSDTLFFYGFDWRKTVRTTSSDLIDEIDRILRLTGAKQVDIMSHSQGGLLTNAALHEGRAICKVHHVVTLGTPYLGAPKLLGVLKYKDPCLASLGMCLIDQDRAKRLIANWPGGLELMPSRDYYGMVDDQRDPNLTFTNLNSAPILLCDPRCHHLSFDEVLRLLQRDGQNMPLLRQSDTFHTDFDNNAVNPPADVGLSSVQIVGSRLETWQTMHVYQETPWWCPWFTHCDPTEKHEWVKGNGDGTVPLHSANRHNSNTGRDDRGGVPEFYAQNAEHGKLPTIKAVLDFAVTFYQAPGNGSTAFPHSAAGAPGERVNAGASPGPVSLSTDPGTLQATDLVATGPLAGFVSDSSGRRLGRVGPRQSVEEIPNSQYEEDLGHDNLRSTYGTSVPDSFRGSWTVTDAGEVAFKFHVYDGDGGSIQVSPRLILPAGAMVSLDYARPQDLNHLELVIADGGAGTVTRRVPFGPPATGSAATDVAPPVSSSHVDFTTNGQGSRDAVVTIAATDTGGSGVGQIQFHNETTGQDGDYSTPLTFPAKGTLIVRALDRAGNVEVAQSISLAPPVGLPKAGQHVAAGSLRWMLAVPFLTGSGLMLGQVSARRRRCDDDEPTG
jgi:hypothetical protein